jgi:hypothetical protein
MAGAGKSNSSAAAAMAAATIAAVTIGAATIAAAAIANLTAAFDFVPSLDVVPFKKHLTSPTVPTGDGYVCRQELLSTNLPRQKNFSAGFKNALNILVTSGSRWFPPLENGQGVTKCLSIFQMSI